MAFTTGAVVRWLRLTDVSCGEAAFWCVLSGKLTGVSAYPNSLRWNRIRMVLELRKAADVVFFIISSAERSAYKR